VSRAVIAVLLVLASQTPAGAQVRIGLATGDSEHCVAMPGAALPAGSPLTLVTLDQPLEVHRAVVTRAVPDCTGMAPHDMRGPYYQLAPEAGGARLPGLSVAVLGRASALVVAGEVRLDLGNGRLEARVRSCSSSEGLHLTLWSGVPLKSTRLWHVYWYLGMDVEPDCQPADYRESGR
jgi:hypothetical protein